MKNILPILIVLFFHLSFTSPIIGQVFISSQTTPIDVDTGIILDAFMFEETVKIVVPMTENIAGEKYELDTIITFDPATFEETIEVVKIKVLTRTPKALEAIEEITLTEAEVGVYQIDTIITFDADTYEETIQVVKTKIKKKH